MITINNLTIINLIFVEIAQLKCYLYMIMISSTSSSTKEKQSK